MGFEAEDYGSGGMISAWQYEQRGFGLVVTADGLDSVNGFRKERGRRPLKGIYEGASLFMARTEKVFGDTRNSRSNW